MINLNIISCKKYMNTLIASESTLPIFVKSYVKEIVLIKRCDRGGFHIWVKSDLKLSKKAKSQCPKRG